MADEELERAKRRAVALRYDASQDQAPRMVAKGRGHLADKIVALAQEHGIHVYHDPDLVALLAKLEVDTEVPADLYQAIAEVLAFVYRLNTRMGQ
ncbi:MAG: hypothetical protein GC168_01640 [Candidatus Hydrogenedens sp.]|nr:hypothetical protein [Candidatus Hydrogenedens sp.]